MIPFAFFKDGKKHNIALVGGGGKTTLMYELAEAYARLGRRTVVMTSTHILMPRRTVWATAESELEALWRQGSYGVIGQLEEATGKLVEPSRALYTYAQQEADIIICEADGAKHRPIKVPREHEPVIPEDCDLVIGVVGLDALGKSWEQACFGLVEAQRLLSVKPEELVTAAKVAQLLLSEQGTRKGVDARPYYLVLNKLDRLENKVVAEELQDLLLQGGIAREKIWLRGREGREVLYG